MTGLRELKQVLGIAAAALLVGASASYSQEGPAQSASSGQPEAAPQEQSTPAPEGTAVSGGWTDLDGMTFGCVKAGLNAAAREAAKAPSEGKYQFSYFRIVNDAHHATYEVHFKSNYRGEPDLRYCVAIYCQQGWDPMKTEVTVSAIANEKRAKSTAVAHGADCNTRHGPASSRAQRH